MKRNKVSEISTQSRSYNFNFIKKIIYILQLTYIRLIGKYIKKNPKVWVFGSKIGESFADNSMYFYKYIKRNHKDIRAIWVSNDPNVIKEVNNFGGEAYKIMSLKALRYILRTKVYVFSHSLDGDIRIYDDKKTYFANLWHGMPIKKIGYDDQTSRREKTLSTQIHNFIRRDILKYRNATDIGDLICSTSDYTKKMMSSAFKSNNVLITGQARGDVIYNSINNKVKKNNVKKSKNQKLILYMPTHRAWGSIQTKNIFENKEFIQKLISFCELNNCIFAIKYHPNEKTSKSIIKNNYIIDISNQGVDVQELLIESDILITDYSSCFIDFAFTKRPMIFYPYDLEEYSDKDMGLYINYETDVPGPIVYDEWKLLEMIDKYIKKPNEYLQIYSNDIVKYHKYIDNKSCERIYQKISDSIKLLI